MLISIITPTFNQLEFLKENIKSVQNSVTKPSLFQFEHIIIDDGSSDGTKEFFENLDHGVKYYRFDKNQGISNALNFGISKAQGDWIFVLDHDDVIFQKTLANFYKAVIQNPLSNWFVFDFIRADQNLSYLLGQDYYGWEFETCTDWLKAVANKEHFVQHNTLFKKSLFNQVKGYDPMFKNALDLDLYSRFVISGSLPKYISNFSHIHRFHQNNTSTIGITIQKSKMPEEIDKIINKYPELRKLRNEV
jgi:glycosyltransferase involved in cell wall biosynthesis